MSKFNEHIPIFKKLRSDLKKLSRIHYYKDELDASDMCGFCAVSSYIVFLYLSKRGFKPKFMLADCHCWIEVDNHFVDLTATQFGFEEEILIKNKKDFYKKYKDNSYEFRKPIKIENVENFKGFIKEWPKGQNPIHLAKKSRIMKQIISEIV